MEEELLDDDTKITRHEKDPRPVPETMADAIEEEEKKQKKNRKRDWENEKDNYKKLEGKTFSYTNTLFSETDTEM